MANFADVIQVGVHAALEVQQLLVVWCVERCGVDAVLHVKEIKTISSDLVGRSGFLDDYLG